MFYTTSMESILNLSLEKIEEINGDVFDIESLEELKLSCRGDKECVSEDMNHQIVKI
ncbi:hypothetical protein [Clostridium sp.]|uniref:hypothetical protein n=1 Tax=Clostridium sp. TaxID=1506 RepID=UPI0034645E24